jgi:membrane-bound lytic murein transglycosylase F
MGYHGRFTIRKNCCIFTSDFKTKDLIRKALLLFAIAGTVFIPCSIHHTSKKPNIVICDLDSIRHRGKLIAITDFNSTDYFIYKGEPMGFNYELLKTFSDNIGIDLEIIPDNHVDHAISMLKSGEADILAFNMNRNSSKQNELLFTTPVTETRQVLVQHKPRNWRSLSYQELDKLLIKDLHGLSRKTIYVQDGSTHAEQLISMAKESGDSVSIIEVPFEAEKLIQNVAKGEIEYTVCDENVALVNSMYFPEIDISTPVSLVQEVSWGIRKNHSDLLQTELNRWIDTYKKTDSYALLYAKYFKNTRSTFIVKSNLYALNTGKVSQYDDMIRQFSSRINWDWRLLASLICQESHFDPDVESSRGAVGLMQIMPGTGKNFGIDVTASPENNLKAGMMYINWLHTIFDSKIPDEKERINFILAAYNAGPGHVLDAMKLAEKNGMDPARWDGNVAVWLLKKSEPKYFRDIVVKNGYFRGVESVNFVSQVLERFEHYKNIIPVEKNHPFGE